MAFITREDGEHFVIPSYRDVLSAKQKSLLKKEILMLSQNYGEYITLQRKNATQYEVAFSTDSGYLLGESIWHQFKRPLDMIYCEAIPNTTEAILVIVKSGSVYLDGKFPLENIPEELVIFLTQQNNFEIYIYGDVPISQTPQEGKFSFEVSSVKSFTVLEAPVFPTLPLLRIYQLQPVEIVLKAHGIGVFPMRKVLMAVAVLVVLWVLYSYITAPAPQVAVAPVAYAPKVNVNPLQGYSDALSSPAPNEELAKYLTVATLILTMPGWVPQQIDYSKGIVTASVLSLGGKVEDLLRWGEVNNVLITIRREGIFASVTFDLPGRERPTNIYPIEQVIGKLIDNLAKVYPGNHLSINDFVNKGAYKDVKFTLNIDELTPVLLSLLEEQMKDLPFVLQGVSMAFQNGKISGSITIEALGS